MSRNGFPHDVGFLRFLWKTGAIAPLAASPVVEFLGLATEQLLRHCNRGVPLRFTVTPFIFDGFGKIPANRSAINSLAPYEWR